MHSWPAGVEWQRPRADALKMPLADWPTSYEFLRAITPDDTRGGHVRWCIFWAPVMLARRPPRGQGSLIVSVPSVVALPSGLLATISIV
jgi:hypothetical protein